MIIPLTLEEFGNKALFLLEIEIEGEIYEDNSGFESFDIYEVTCTSAWGENWEWTKNHRPDWFEFLDQIVLEYIFLNEDHFVAQCVDRYSYD